MVVETLKRGAPLFLSLQSIDIDWWYIQDKVFDSKVGIMLPSPHFFPLKLVVIYWPWSGLIKSFMPCYGLCWSSVVCDSYRLTLTLWRILAWCVALSWIIRIPSIMCTTNQKSTLTNIVLYVIFSHTHTARHHCRMLLGINFHIILSCSS